MFSSPFLAKCSDRASLPKQHPNSGSPEDWFSDDMLARHKLYGLTFDFFINWSLTPSTLTPVIWIKKVLSESYSYDQIVNDINAIMKAELGESYMTLLESFMSKNKLSIQFIIFRDDFDWSNDESSLLVVTFNGRKNDDFNFSGDIVSIIDFKTAIQGHSGGPIKIGSKGLMYGTSKLECFLSRTSSLYPGDADLIVFDEKFLPIAVLEYKKHTLSDSISSQKLSNYYPYPDGRKYNRLSILRDYLQGSNSKLPLLVLYYPTNSTFKEGRLELLKGTTGVLLTNIASNFILPKNKSTEEYDEIIDKLLKAVSYYQSLS